MGWGERGPGETWKVVVATTPDLDPLEIFWCGPGHKSMLMCLVLLAWPACLHKGGEGGILYGASKQEVDALNPDWKLPESIWRCAVWNVPLP